MVSRVAWTILVPFCLVLAVVSVVTIVRQNVGGTEEASPYRPSVRMENIAFTPDALTVSRATEVVFDNADVAPHTVTADDGSFDSGIIGPGDAYRLVVNQAFGYHCEIHPSMTAEIRLEG